MINKSDKNFIEIAIHPIIIRNLTNSLFDSSNLEFWLMISNKIKKTKIIKIEPNLSVPYSANL